MSKFMAQPLNRKTSALKMYHEFWTFGTLIQFLGFSLLKIGKLGTPTVHASGGCSMAELQNYDHGIAKVDKRVLVKSWMMLFCDGSDLILIYGVCLSNHCLRREENGRHIFP
ncbi:hypothetical protein Nepgr_001952 [Nepenthes gracilis]|uniref:Uncharacterized protein n=1 Tax=Nepenthes gracilis TaxID=150966 RepID=A0AAD3P845_NEPGR|nr:hypothetical protein Nepgr_001952 [Nepenthes gracilis]